MALKVKWATQLKQNSTEGYEKLYTGMLFGLKAIEIDNSVF